MRIQDFCKGVGEKDFADIAQQSYIRIWVTKLVLKEASSPVLHLSSAIVTVIHEFRVCLRSGKYFRDQTLGINIKRTCMRSYLLNAVDSA